MSTMTSSASTPAAASSPSGASLPQVTSRRIADLVASVHPSTTLEPELEALLLELADDFVDSVVSLSAVLARQRQSKLLDVKDVQLTLQQHWGMRVPGFFSPEDVLAEAGVRPVGDEADAPRGADKDFTGGFEGLKAVRAVRRQPISEAHRKRLQAVASAKAQRDGISAMSSQPVIGSGSEAKKRKRLSE